MNSFRVRIGFTVGLMAMLLVARLGHAAAEATASPEPGDTSATKTIPGAFETVTPEAAPSTTAATPGTTGEEPAIKFEPKRIEQRVDNASTEDVIRVTPRPKKNVYRIDNLPNRPKVTPVAVIKGPVSPWGYATRYINGEVDRPSAKDLQGTSNNPNTPGANRGGTNLPSTRISLGGSRRAEQRDARRNR